MESHELVFHYNSDENAEQSIFPLIFQSDLVRGPTIALVWASVLFSIAFIYLPPRATPISHRITQLRHDAGLGERFLYAAHGEKTEASDRGRVPSDIAWWFQNICSLSGM